MDNKPKVLPEFARPAEPSSRYRRTRRQWGLTRAPNPSSPRDEQRGSSGTNQPQQRFIGLLVPDETVLQQYERDLVAFGFTVQPCRDVAELCAVASGQPLAAVALVAPLLNIHMAIAQLRIASPYLDIIAIADFPDRQSRIGTLLSGADACIDMASDALEVAAALLVLQRRRHGNHACADPTGASQPDLPSDTAATSAAAHLPKPRCVRPADASGTWRLMDKGWTLASPDGNCLVLTSSERQLMLALVASPDRTINRDTSLLLPHGVDMHGHGASRGRRYLDVIVSRLRRKGALHNIDVPIRSVRGEGYSFVSECLGPNADTRP